MSSKTRRYFTAEKKAQIVRRHLADKIEISDLADEFEGQPSQIQTWIKQVLDQGERALERSGAPRRTDKAKDHKIAQLEEKLTTKNEVIAEPTGSIASGKRKGSLLDVPGNTTTKNDPDGG